MFSERLINLRKSKKWRQEDMAKKLGVARTTYASYEQGHRQPDYETLIAISNIFEVTIDYLLKGEDYRSQAKEILDNPDTQYAARDGEISESEALDRIARILEKQKGRVPGQRQQRPKRN
ncbi:transcriptional regulator with XRE-family HTH domain [Cytobacillus horneckiae]|uniref:helix-turn-helix domain-containing protein n=1 Tax=Cytobacillus horneckiae TaxID=549687 RepID=UPI0019CF52BC|nr:helix-turn-helix transcriptional regulator [Cytobacillus horneckiae]MBN6889805.1 helix-turn-helix transcriptional regulator [Cytobacillus horneckiae]